MSGTELQAHFEDLHAASDDPWSVTTRRYEQRKRRLTIELLPLARYHRAFEPGCSVGAFTEMLAGRCGQLLAVDGSPSAVESCRERTKHLDNVTVEQRHLPAEWPTGPFDLVVLSEIGYYLQAEELDEVLALTVAALAPEGALLAVHWRQVADDFVLAGGDDVHERIRAVAGLDQWAAYVDQDFRADVFVPIR